MLPFHCYLPVKSLNAQIIAKIMEKMMPIEKKYNFMYSFMNFLIKFHKKHMSDKKWAR